MCYWGEPMQCYNFVLDAPALRHVLDAPAPPARTRRPCPSGTYLTPLPLRASFPFGTNLLMHRWTVFRFGMRQATEITQFET